MLQFSWVINESIDNNHLCRSLCPMESMVSTGILWIFFLKSLCMSILFLAPFTSSAKSLWLRSSLMSSNLSRRSLDCHRKSSSAWRKRSWNQKLSKDLFRNSRQQKLRYFSFIMSVTETHLKCAMSHTLNILLVNGAPATWVNKEISNFQVKKC